MKCENVVYQFNSKKLPGLICSVRASCWLDYIERWIDVAPVYLTRDGGAIPATSKNIYRFNETIVLPSGFIGFRDRRWKSNRFLNKVCNLHLFLLSKLSIFLPSVIHRPSRRSPQMKLLLSTQRTKQTLPFPLHSNASLFSSFKVLRSLVVCSVEVYSEH